MRVVCVNDNGWYKFKGNNYCFLEKRMEIFAHPECGKEYKVSKILLDEHGDIIYRINKYPDGAWDDDGFIILPMMKARNKITNNKKLKV